MSKRHRNMWDEEPMAFQTSLTSPDYHTPDLYELDDVQEDVEFLEEAHEALSKLFNRTNKRARQLKGVRRKDAWQ